MVCRLESTKFDASQALFQPVIADTSMCAVASSGAWRLSQMMEMGRKLALFPEILETEK